jgi:hypothetical protein
MTLHDELVLAFNLYLKEQENFDKHGVKVSAVRARKALQDLRHLSAQRRKQLQQQKEEI